MLHKFSTDRISYQIIAIEIFSVIFAVLIALTVDNYKEARKNDTLARDTLQQIIQEIRQNRDDLDSTVVEQVKLLTEQQKMLDNLKAYLEKGTSGKAQNLTLEFAWNFAELDDNAWKSATMTQAVRYMDFETVREIALIYQLQTTYLEQYDLIIEDMVAPVYFRGAFDTSVAAQYGSQLVKKSMSLDFAKSHLLIRYAELLEKYESN